jgi:carbon monoxide dehydrogenase subunit G
VTGRNDDGSYNGAFTVKIGPTTASYTGKLHMDSIDVDAHTATMHANGTDKRGHGGAKAQIISRLETVDGKTRVMIDTDYTITGRLARFGRGGMIEDISERLLREFATRLQASLVGAGETGSSGPEPTGAGAESGGAPASEDAVGTAAGPPPPAIPHPLPPAEPLDAGSLVGSVLLDRARRNPAPIVAALAALVMVVLLLGRGRRRRHPSAAD